MLQLSYWLFPMIFVVFVFWPASRPFLLPGLVAAGAAGAANSVVVEKYPSALGHAFAAALAVYMAASSAPPATEVGAAALGVLAWTVLALAVASAIPEDSWPYALSKPQMLALFIPFLAVGAAGTLPGALSAACPEARTES